MTLEELESKLGEHASRVKEIGEEIRSLVEKNDSDSKARLDELSTEQKRITDEVAPLLAEKKAAEQEAAVKATQDQLEALMGSIRTASKSGDVSGFTRRFASDREYEAGSFLRAIVDMKSGDPEAFTAGKAVLEQISTYEGAWGKATLGSTDATGGWIIPNAIVEDIIKPAGFDNPYPALCTVVDGVTAPAVDLPFRSARPARAVVAAFGATKENVDLTYNGYTATMYTLARVHDVSNQFLRQSQGAAEADVLGELATAFALGERYYIISGSGSSEPYGLATAITNAPATFTSTFTAAATQAGSAISAIATAAGALAGRGRGTGLTAVVNAATLWTAVVGQGTDTAGFWFAGTAGAPSLPNINAGTAVTPFGIPVLGDDQLASDDLIVGQFKALKIFHGQSYRVDSSSVAGTRWDTNLTGFRGEMELGLDARPAVYAGAFQFVADIVP